jgi:hypothetical protein
MSVFKRLRRWRESKFDNAGLGLERLVLVRHLQPSARRSARARRFSDFSAMSLTPVVLLLLIVLFRFDRTNRAPLKNLRFSEMSPLERLRKQCARK